MSSESFRIPSVPLITCDPYFSLWSPDDRLTGRPVCHWTGAEKPVDAFLVVDGEELRFMGTGSNGRPMRQTGFDFTATSSRYVFEDGGIELTVMFRTPLLMSDLDLMSRPVSYIEVSARSVDGQSRRAEAVFVFDERHCYDGNERKPLIGGVHDCGSFAAAWMGRKRQAPLSHSGDGVTIDWGYFYAAVARGAGEVRYESGDRSTVRAALKLEAGAEPGRALLLVAYDDILSIQYFGDARKGYWARNGATILKAMADALEDFETISARCDVFDQELCRSALAAGGEDYAFICAAAYRQAIGAHKLICDGEGNPVLISKECFSNGCAATVDVSYPSTPIFLLYRPELVHALIRPILKFAHSPVWEFGFAPHDAGRYPYVWGQVYGLREDTISGADVFPPYWSYPAGSGIYDPRYQMPVEECGNMLIMAAAASAAMGTAEPFRAEMPLLEKWAAYLVKQGADPGEQLCTDDFAGHLAHNANLAAKAVIGIWAFSKLASMLGRKNEADSYRSAAKAMALKWKEMSDAGDHTALTFGNPESWSLKYNLVWDILFGGGLFDADIYRRETAWYLKKCNDYGIPLDSRADYTKSDWQMWAAAFSEDPQEVARFSAPMARFLRESPSRVPFSDWYDTYTAKVVGFQNRTVQGGLFMPLLRKRGLAE